MSNPKTKACDVCSKEFPFRFLTPADFIRNSVTALIVKKIPTWNEKNCVCPECLSRLRAEYVQNLLVEEKGELTQLEQDVIESLREQDILAENLNQQAKDQMTFGQRVADQVATFGGSWTFIIFFGVVLVVWIFINTVAIFSKPFDPYPFILLNLVLSCLAAIQAPVIMMSQNRQEAKDRLRSENDYRVNLKAELEIRHLHAKIDLLLSHQWQRLLEVQQVQIDLLEELRANTKGMPRA